MTTHSTDVLFHLLRQRSSEVDRLSRVKPDETGQVLVNGKFFIDQAKAALSWFIFPYLALYAILFRGVPARRRAAPNLYPRKSTLILRRELGPNSRGRPRMRLGQFSGGFVTFGDQLNISLLLDGKWIPVVQDAWPELYKDWYSASSTDRRRVLTTLAELGYRALRVQGFGEQVSYYQTAAGPADPVDEATAMGVRGSFGAPRASGHRS